MNKRLKRLSITLIVVLVILGGIQASISPLLRNYINSHGQQLIGREVQIENMFVNIFNSSLRINNITVYEADGQAEFFSCEEFSTRIRVLPLIFHRFIISRIAVQGATVNVIQNGAQFNYDDLIAHLMDGEQDTTAGDQNEKNRWDVGIYNIGIKNSHITYHDLIVHSDWRMNNFSLDIPGFYLSSENTNIGLHLDFPQGGSLDSKIEYGYAQSTYDLTLTLRDFSIEGLLPYLRQYLNVSQVSGLLDSDVRVTGNTNHLLDVDVSGSTILRRFSLLDDGRGEVVSADSIFTMINQISLQREEYLLREMSVHGLISRYEMYADSTNSLSSLMRETQASEQTEEDTPRSNSHIAIGKFSIQGGRIEVTDNTPLKPFHYTIADVDVSCVNLNPDAYCSVTARATLNHTGTVHLNWTGNPSDGANHNITVELRNIDMTHFSPYTEVMFGYPFASGTLSFSGQNVIRNNQLTGTNHIDVFNPKLDKKLKDVKPQYKIPLRMGIYLLTDRSGNMKIDVPVTGDLNNPRFSYRRIIVGAMTNTLIKVIASPAKYLAQVMGIGEDMLEYIEIDPSQNEFTSEQYDKLSQLGTMMRNKPELRLSLTQGYNLDGALAGESLSQLKRAFYLRCNPSKANMSLEMFDNEAALSIDPKSKQLGAYADSLLKVAGKRASGDITSKASALYANSVEQQLLTYTQERNVAILNHMSTKLGLDESVFVVRTLSTDSLRTYKGRNCYHITMSIPGEVAYAGSMPPEGE